jgi:transposase
VIDLDELGPESAKSFPGQEAIDVTARPVQRAKQEVDYGRRGKGYIFGAFQATTGEAFTQDYRRRTSVNWLDFLERVDAWVPAEVERVDAWVPAEVERVYAILDNLNVHHSENVLFFLLTHPRWEFVFQPTYAAYLNLIEPWWKILRSLAFKGRRFETWEDLATAGREATAYWNAHKHPFVWGRRRRHRAPRRPGIGLLPTVA